MTSDTHRHVFFHKTEIDCQWIKLNKDHKISDFNELKYLYKIKFILIAFRKMLIFYNSKDKLNFLAKVLFLIF